MDELTVYAMTRKGLAVVEAVQRVFPGLIRVVVSARDSAVHDDCYDLIRAQCSSHRIEFVDRCKFKSSTTPFAMAVSWRWMIDQASTRLIVFHDSLLPLYRGFNPLVTALINGDDEVGVCALYGAGDYDRGDIIAIAPMTVSYPAKIRDVIDRIAHRYVDLALDVCGSIARGNPPPAAPQDDSKATYSLWRDEDDYFIDWGDSSRRIKRAVDALGYPYKGAACWLDDRVVRIVDAEVVNDVVIDNRTPGKVLFVAQSKPVVACGEGLLRIDAMVDEEGRSVLPLRRFRQRLTRPAIRS